MFYRVADGLSRLFMRRRNHHPLPLRQSVSLYDYGKFMLIEIGQSWT